jgi:hypothetical protein
MEVSGQLQAQAALLTRKEVVRPLARGVNVAQRQSKPVEKRKSLALAGTRTPVLRSSSPWSSGYTDSAVPVSYNFYTAARHLYSHWRYLTKLLCLSHKVHKENPLGKRYSAVTTVIRQGIWVTSGTDWVCTLKNCMDTIISYTNDCHYFRKYRCGIQSFGFRCIILLIFLLSST